MSVEETKGEEDMADTFLEIRSMDAFSFYVPLQAAAEASRRMMDMASIPGGEKKEASYIITLPYSSYVVAKVCQYIIFRATIGRTDTTGNVPEFNVSAEDAVSLLEVAMFLDL